MASTYPAAIDSFTNPTPTSDEVTLSHSGLHSAAFDAIHAIETELGTLPKGSSADVKTRLTAAEATTAAEVARAMAAEALLAPLSGPALTGSATLGGVALETVAGSQAKATAAQAAAVAASDPSGSAATSFAISMAFGG